MNVPCLVLLCPPSILLVLPPSPSTAYPHLPGTWLTSLLPESESQKGAILDGCERSGEAPPQPPIGGETTRQSLVPRYSSVSAGTEPLESHKARNADRQGRFRSHQRASHVARSEAAAAPGGARLGRPTAQPGHKQRARHAAANGLGRVGDRLHRRSLGRLPFLLSTDSHLAVDSCGSVGSSSRLLSMGDGSTAVKAASRCSHGLAIPSLR